jgi:hypothetical protein
VNVFSRKARAREFTGARAPGPHFGTIKGEALATNAKADHRRSLLIKAAALQFYDSTLGSRLL